MDHIKLFSLPAKRKYTAACSDYAETHVRVSFTRAQSLVDIFEAAWPEIVEIYDVGI